MFHIKVSVGYSSRRMQGASTKKEQALKQPGYAKLTIFSDNATTQMTKKAGKQCSPAHCIHQIIRLLNIRTLVLWTLRTALRTVLRSLRATLCTGIHAF